MLHLGVHNVDLHAHKATQQHKQEEAVKRIQAAYRGHQVRKSLHWDTNTHQKIQQSTLTSSNDEHKRTTVMKSKKSTKKRLQDKPKVVEEIETVHIDPADSSVRVPATSVPPWEQAGGDMMSVINIYTRQYEKLQEQFNATAGV